MKGFRWFLAMVAALGLLTSACGGDDAEGGDSAATSALGDDTTAASETDEPAAPSGTLRLGGAVSVPSLDPLVVPAVQPVYGYAVFDGLLREEETEVIVPALAEEFVVDEAAGTVTLTLRDGVVFHDGEPFNAAAVVANFDRAKALPENSYRAFYGALQSVEAPDESTVVLTFDPLPPDVVLQLARVPGWMLSPASFDDPEFDLNPVGTGPYRFNAAESRIGEILVFDLFEDYWAPELQGVERIEMITYDRNALLNAIQSDELHIVGGLVGADVAALRAAGLNLVEPPPSVPHVLWIPDHEGRVVEALGDPGVREAMALAIDAAGFVEGPFQGDGVITNQFAPAGSWAHFDSLEGRHEQNLERARELMEEAGYGDGFTCQGVVGVGTVTEPWTQAVARFLAEIGVTVELTQAQGGQYLTDARSGNFNCIGMTISWTGDPASHLASFLTLPPILERFGPLPQEITDLVDAGAATTDPDERAPIYEELYAKLFDLGIVSVFFSGVNNHFVDPAVQGVHPVGQAFTLADPRGVRLSES